MTAVHLLIAWAFGAGTGLAAGIALARSRMRPQTVVHHHHPASPPPKLTPGVVEALRRDMDRAARRNGGIVR